MKSFLKEMKGHWGQVILGLAYGVLWAILMALLFLMKTKG